MDGLERARTQQNTRTLAYVSQFICYLLILLPAALGVLYVRAFGVSVVKGDAWSMVPLFDRWSSGTLQVSDFFVQHNENRSAFPEVVELLMGIVTKYNNVAEMYLIQACLLATLIILLAAFRANSKSSWGLFLFIPVSLLIFSFRQHSNMLFGYQINFAFVEMFGVLTLFLLYILGRNSHKNLVFLSALMSATASTFSVVSGLLVWPAGLLQLLVGPLEKPEKRVFIMLWSLVGLTEWTIYLRGWTPGRDCSSFIEWCYQKAQYQGNPGDRSVVSPLLHIFENPLADIDFFLSLLANSLLWPNHQATVAVLVVGLLLICLALVGLPLVKKNRKLGENSFWV